MNALKVVNETSNSYSAIHGRAMAAAENYKRSEIELLEAIFEVEARQIYFQMEIKSLFLYCVEMLGLSRHASYDFITVMRKSLEVPALLEAIRDGSTTVSKARKVCSVINERNAKDWIGLTRECSSRIVERAVAMANPRDAVVESMKFVSGDVLELKFAVSEEWSELLGDVKDLMSQKSKRAVTTEEALFQLMSDYKLKNDPVLKASRVERKRNLQAAGSERKRKHHATVSVGIDNADLSVAENSENGLTIGFDLIALPVHQSSTSRYIPAAIRHKVAIRDNGKCTFVDRHGKRCGSGRWVQKHHVQHFAEGGSHAAENLETLCWAHHVMKHRTKT